MQETFSRIDAATVTGLSVADTWAALFHGQLDDDVYCVASNNGKFRLLPQPPQKAAIDHWRKRCLPILRGLGACFSPTKVGGVVYEDF